jgi:tetratricopeptide (TPR) repeat protein
VIVPLSLFITLLIVRILSYIWYVSLNRRPLPVVIHDLAPGPGRDGLDQAGASPSPQQFSALYRLPAVLRDYISADPPLSRQLAPGVAGAASPAISVAAAGQAQPSWSTALVNLVLPQKQASYNIHLSPHGGEPGFCVSVLLVKTPQQWIEASRTFRDDTLDGLTHQIGGFCMERVRLQPPFLRRAPRWEHWGNRGSYSLFRRALAFQEDKDFERAYEAFGTACGLSPGNIRLGVHRASLYELQQRYREAAGLYDALHSLWRQNVEVIYRAAAARINRAHDLLAQRAQRARPPHSAKLIGVPQPRQGAAPAGAPGSAAGQPEELRLTGEADRFLELTKQNLGLPFMLWRWFKTWLPRRRDIGERRYWLSWLRRDTYSQPLMLLRRSKRYEYLCAVNVAIEANRLLTALIGDQLGYPVAPFDMDKSFTAVIRLVKRKRAGWLAHWTAACYFARAAQAATLISPQESSWRKYERRSRHQPTLGLPGNDHPRGWRRYCEDTAIGEIGRVIRNPCNQLNPELLHNDPDMKPLSDAFQASTVAVLLSRLREQV